MRIKQPNIILLITIIAQFVGSIQGIWFTFFKLPQSSLLRHLLMGQGSVTELLIETLDIHNYCQPIQGTVCRSLQMRIRNGLGA